MSKTASGSVLALAAAFFGCFLFWPLAEALRGAFYDPDGKFTFLFIAETFKSRVYAEGLLNALLIGAASTLFSLALALPLAWIADRVLFPGKKIFAALVLVPMVLPPFVGAIGIKQIFGQMGALNALLHHAHLLGATAAIDWLGRGRFWSVVALNGLHLYPILYLNLTAALANIDPAMEEAAENLGATGWRKFWKITLPLMMPSLFSGGTIVFIWAFTELGVPLMCDFTRTTPVQIFHGIREISANPFPYALVVITLFSTAILYLTSRLLFGRELVAATAKATTTSQARPVSTATAVFAFAFFTAVTALALLPHLSVILISFSRDWYQTLWPQQWTLAHYEAALGHDLTVPSIINSLKYASLSTALDLVLGTGIAWYIIRSRARARHFVDLLTMLPLAIPGLVLAFGYVAMTQEGRLFSFLNPTRDPTALLVIAYAVRRLPYVVRSVAAGLQQVSASIEEAAQNLGATPWRSLRKITLPLISANVIAGGLLAFSFAALEVSESLILAQKRENFPITKAIYEMFQLLGEGRFVASALGVWAMCFLALSIFAATRLLRKRMGALFRI